MFLINLIQPFLKWLIRLLLLLFLIGFLFSIFNLFNNTSTYIPRPIVEENADEKLDKDFVIPKDTLNIDTFTKDSVITRKRIWKDYDGAQYTGV